MCGCVCEGQQQWSFGPSGRGRTSCSPAELGVPGVLSGRQHWALERFPCKELPPWVQPGREEQCCAARRLEVLAPGGTLTAGASPPPHPRRYLSLLRSTDGPEYAATEFQAARTEKFKLLLLTKQHHPPDELLKRLLPIQVVLAKGSGYALRCAAASAAH